MEKDCGIKIPATKRGERGQVLGTFDLDAVYEASAAEFAWWFCERAFPDYNKDDIRTWKNWGTIASSSVDPAFRLRCVKYLRDNGLIPEDTRKKDSEIKSKVASEINEVLGR